MKLFVAKETNALETRIALIPDNVSLFKKAGLEVLIEKNLGDKCGILDSEYEKSGAKIVSNKQEGYKSADIVVRVLPPEEKELSKLKKGSLHISFLDPFNRSELLDEAVKAKVSVVSLEMIVRSTLAQKMDAISSQANIAGYASVMIAAERIKRIIPMMMTPAGTISPLKIFILGIGVAGLQAIATAKRLGARVTAFDVREEALEQAESLGAKALRIDLGETGSTDQGYAKELTKEQLQKQQEEQAKVCQQSDIVITTAKLFGRKSPVLIKKDVVKKMNSNSVIVDLATETGGNVDGSKVNEEIKIKDGPLIIGHGTLERMYPQSASQVFSSNITNFIKHFWDEEKKEFNYDLEDNILKSCLLVKDGELLWKKPR